MLAGRSPSFLHTYASTFGDKCACVPTAPEIFPTAMTSRARRRRSSARPNSSYINAIFRPNVVGSAWTPCVRPIIGVSLYFFALRATTLRSAFTSAMRMSTACTI